MKKGIENYPVFISFLFFTILTYIFSSLGFIVPKWLEKWPHTKGTFENIGLWEVCFKNYMHDDIYDKLFSDCFNINDATISELQSWIIKDWFQAFRIFYTVSFLILMFSTFFVIAMCLNTVNKFSRRNGYVLLGLMLIGWFCCLVSLGLFGHYTDIDTNNNWMPNPEQLTLSWSFGCGSLSLLGYMICIGHLGYSFTNKNPLRLRWYCGKMQNDDNDTGDMALLNAERGNTHTKSSIYDPRGNSTIDDRNAEEEDVKESQVPSIMSHNASRSQMSNKTPSQLISPVSAGQKPQHGRYVPKPAHHGSNSELRIRQDNSMTSPPASHLTGGSSQMSIPRSQMHDYTTVIESKPMKKRYK